jgi:hypothetical protein
MILNGSLGVLNICVHNSEGSAKLAWDMNDRACRRLASLLADPDLGRVSLTVPGRHADEWCEFAIEPCGHGERVTGAPSVPERVALDWRRFVDKFGDVRECNILRVAGK